LTVTVLHSTYRPEEIGRNELALDSAATACLARERAILTNLRTCKHTAEITGVSGEVLTTNVIGDLKDGLGEAYYHPKAVANIIPFGRVESTFDMKWVRNAKFHFTNQDGKEISFNKRSTDSVGNGLYIYDMTPVATQKKPKPVTKELVAITTVDENKSHYTKRELKQAEEAKAFMKKTGYPSVADAIKIIESGAITDCPIAPADILRARDIWGADLASLKGKTVHKNLKRVREDFLPKPKKSTAIQDMYADICFLVDKPYMLSITQSLNMIMIKDLNGKRDAATISDAIVGMVLQYRSRGFRIDKLFSDSERGMEASKRIFHAEGIDLDLSNAGEHVPIIERNVRFIKERIRTVLSGLPYRLPNKFMPYLADHAVMMINSFPRPSSHDPISPREHFTGRKLNYKRDVRVSLGEYAQVIIPNATSNDVRQPRTEGAIALLNTGNANSSVYFYVLRSGQVVARDRFTVLPMKMDVITRLENMAGRNTKGSDDIEMNRNDDVTFEEDEDEDSVRVYVPREVQDLPPQTEGLDLIQEAPDEPDSLEEDLPDDVPADEEALPPLEPRYSLRNNPKQTDWYIRKPFSISYFGFRVSLKQALKDHPVPALESILKELKQLLDKRVFSPVKKSDLTNDQIKKIIGSFMFLKEKFRDGLFEKLNPD
jgi:hypothetical protein